MPDIYVNWNDIRSKKLIQIVTEAEYNRFKAECGVFGLHIKEVLITAEQGGNVQILAVSDHPISTSRVFKETRAWLVDKGIATMPETDEKINAFEGELMKCVMCRKEQAHKPAVQSNWTVIQVDGKAFYVCPACLQDHPQTKKTGNFAGRYQVVLRRILKVMKQS